MVRVDGGERENRDWGFDLAWRVEEGVGGFRFGVVASDGRWSGLVWGGATGGGRRGGRLLSFNCSSMEIGKEAG